MNSKRVWWVALVPALAAMAVFVMVSGDTVKVGSAQAAQPAPTPAAGVAGARVEVTVGERSGARADPYPITASGTVNTDGDAAFEVRVSGIGAPIQTRLVDGRAYVALLPGVWVTLDLPARIGQVAEDAGIGAAACRSGGQGIGRLLADPLAAFGGGLSPVAQGETLDGVTVDRYGGRVPMTRLYEDFGAFFGLSGDCGRALATTFLGETAGPTATAEVEVTVGRENDFPYRIRILVPQADDRTLEVTARLTPSATPFSTTAPVR